MTYIQLALAFIAGAASAFSVAAAKVSEPSAIAALGWYGVAAVSFLALAFVTRAEQRAP